MQTIFYKKNIIKLDDEIISLFDNSKERMYYQVSKKDTFLSDDYWGPGKGVYFY